MWMRGGRMCRPRSSKTAVGDGNSGTKKKPAEDDRPTIDKPPKGELWDDQRAGRMPGQSIR